MDILALPALNNWISSKAIENNVITYLNNIYGDNNFKVIDIENNININIKVNKWPNDIQIQNNIIKITGDDKRIYEFNIKDLE